MLVLLDLSAAFDTVDHGVFVVVYVNGLSHTFVIAQIRVKIHNLLTCLPQGSVIGPIPFLRTLILLQIIKIKCYTNILYFTLMQIALVHFVSTLVINAEVNYALSSLSKCIF